MSAMTATLLLLVVLGTAKRNGKLAAWRQDHERQINPQFACTHNRRVPHGGTKCVSASEQQEFMMWWLPVGSLRASPHIHEQYLHRVEAWGSVGGPDLTLYSPLHESKHGKVNVCQHCRIRMHSNACKKMHICEHTHL